MIFDHRDIKSVSPVRLSSINIAQWLYNFALLNTYDLVWATKLKGSSTLAVSAKWAGDFPPECVQVQTKFCSSCTHFGSSPFLCPTISYQISSASPMKISVTFQKILAMLLIALHSTVTLTSLNFFAILAQSLPILTSATRPSFLH